MDLDALYYQVSETISTIDFKRIWQGFAPIKFALFDDEMCFFDGHFIEKTDAFFANTFIRYQGEPIAIWKITDELGIPVLTAKIIHEMFHAYQSQQGWDCWADEMEAVYRYEYSAENLSLKLRENELLLALLDRFDEAAYHELLSHRKLRSQKVPYEFSYESKVEEIEGTANYVEWQVLKQLDEKEAAAQRDRMRRLMTKPEYLFPIRISSYDTGALLVNTLLKAGLYSFDAAERPVMMSVLRTAHPSDGGFPGKESYVRIMSDTIAAFNEESRLIVESALEKNEVVLNGPLELISVNIYDARHYKGFTTSKYFLMIREAGKERTLSGDFVIRMKDEKTIDRVYRWG